MAYVKSPVIFTNGIANGLPGGLLPIISITQAADYAGVLNGTDSLTLNDLLFDFQPLPGAKLNSYQIGAFPFANQQIAANAIIREPNSISLMMQAPVRDIGGYDEKLSVFGALKAAIDQHASLGGTYTIATPSYLYTNCILLEFQDASSGVPDKPQDRWRWDFIQPLLTLDQAQQAQNSLMSKISNGTQVTPAASGAISPSGQGPAVGNPASGQGPSTVPAATPLPGASAASSSAGLYSPPDGG